MSRGLLSGLDKAEKSPYSGWKTNIIGQSVSPENDDVCLLDESLNHANDQHSSLSKESGKCFSDGHRSPQDFDAKMSGYKIPKKASGSPDVKERKAQSWIEPSFRKKDNALCGSSQMRVNLRPIYSTSPSNKRKLDNEIGFRILRQGLCTPKNRKGEVLGTPNSRWKHTNPPGWRGKPTSLRNYSSSQGKNAYNDEKCNGSVSEVSTRTNVQKDCSSLEEEQKQNLSILDHLMDSKPKPVDISLKAHSNGDISSSNDTDSDNNFRKKSRRQETPNSSKDLLSDDNYEDCFRDYYCAKCTTKLSQTKNCSHCSKDDFPSQAATPRKPLSPERFYNSGKQPNVQRTYNRQRRNGVPKLVESGSIATMTSAKRSNNETCQTNLTAKKRKNEQKSNSEDSDSEQKLQVKRKRNGKQSKTIVPKKVDVITLSDEEEVIETTAELIIEQSDSAAKEPSSSSVTVIPESPLSQDDVVKEDATESKTMSSSVCSDTLGKRKTPPLKEEQNVKKKSDSVQPYARDETEIEIMLGQNIRIGTLACTATKPLKITCCNDEISFDVDIGNKNCAVTISGNNLSSFKINTASNPGLVVLGVTPGYALKLRERIDPNRGAFLNPGSAVAAERDIVLEVSEHVKQEVIADLMEWVTDKLSKEFAELSIKEVERIMSYKASATTSSEQKKSSGAASDVATSTPMATRSRAYNTRTSSHKQPALPAQKLIVYPRPPQPGGITVTTEDVACLAAGEFLNDVIIDFYLKYIFFEKLKPADRERTHILSSFFYKRLTQRNANNSSDTFTSTPDRMHSQVRTWTKNVDIFEKDFVIVPINESSHWYLAVICFAGQDSPTYVKEISDEDDDSDTKNEDPDTAADDEPKSGHDDDDDDDSDFLVSLLATNRKKKPKQNTGKSLSKQIIKSQPCILVFDSLGCKRPRPLMNLRNYLKCEWRERKKQPATRVFDTHSIRGSHTKVPGQDNYCDCGVYVLQYVESFFKDPITDFTLPIKKPDWFSSIAEKRTEIRELIYNLKECAEVDNVS